MITIKKPEEVELLRKGGNRLAYILKQVADMVEPGVRLVDLNIRAEELIKEQGDASAFLGYTPYGARTPFPASLCVSINEEIVHGIPNKDDRVLKEGDIVSLDLGLIREGLYTDHAITVPVGKISKEAKELIGVTKQSLQIGIDAIKPGGHVGDIGAAIKKYVDPYGFGIIEVLSGHGVGYAVHEDPFVPNTAKRGQGPKLKPGMVLAIEPMLTLGSINIVLDKSDGYTYRSKDHSLAAHFEHTVVVTDTGAEILTKE